MVGQFSATRERIPGGEELFLLGMHDTTEFSYKREDMAAVGLIGKGSMRRDAQGRPLDAEKSGLCNRARLKSCPAARSV
jgi:hypothetical protein